MAAVEDLRRRSSTESDVLREEMAVLFILVAVIIMNPDRHELRAESVPGNPFEDVDVGYHDGKVLGGHLVELIGCMVSSHHCDEDEGMIFFMLLSW